MFNKISSFQDVYSIYCTKSAHVCVHKYYLKGDSQYLRTLTTHISLDWVDKSLLRVGQYFHDICANRGIMTY